MNAAPSDSDVLMEKMSPCVFAIAFILSVCCGCASA